MSDKETKSMAPLNVFIPIGIDKALRTKAFIEERSKADVVREILEANLGDYVNLKMKPVRK